MHFEVEDGGVEAMARCLVAIDTDLMIGPPGEKVDDAFALALALACPELDVRAVSTVEGNGDLATVTARTAAFLAVLGRADVPVLPGGLPDGGAAARALATWAIDDPGEVTLVAIGPLTTVAAALGADPRVAAGLAEIVVMGGRFLGPRGAPPETNARLDPWAARAVLQAEARVRVVGLDVTDRMALTPADLERLSRGGAVARYLGRAARQRLGVLASSGVTTCPLHDPLAVLAVTHPGLMTWRAAEIEVVLDGPRRGETSAVLLDEAAATLVSCQVAVDVDAAAAKNLLITRLLDLP